MNVNLDFNAYVEAKEQILADYEDQDSWEMRKWFTISQKRASSHQIALSLNIMQISGIVRAKGGKQ